MDENNINFNGNNQGPSETGRDILSTLDKNSGFQDNKTMPTSI